MLHKKKPLKKTLQSSVPLLLTIFALFVLKIFIIKFFCQALPFSKTSLVYNVFRFLMNIFLTFLWFWITFTLCRNHHYREVTGRTFFKDKKKYYTYSYRELLEYFNLTSAEPHKLDTSNFPKISWKEAENYFIFGTQKKRLICVDAFCESNLLVAGPPGSFKTSGVIIPNAMQFPGSILAIDIKSDIYNFCKGKREIVRFCPDSPTALQDSAHFNPFAGINEMNIADKKLFVEHIALILIPDSCSGDAAIYFTSRARKAMCGIIFLLLERAPQHNLSFPDFVHATLSKDLFYWTKEAHKGSSTEAFEYLASFANNNEKNLSGVYDALCNALLGFSNPVLDELLCDNGNCISISMLEQGKNIFLQISQEHLQTSYANLLTLVMQTFSDAFSRRPDLSTGAKLRPILCLCDEFPALTFSTDLITTALSTHRSKGIIWCLAIQNLSQLQARYGQTGTRTILGNTNYQAILSSNDLDSSTYWSRLFGTKKVLKITDSESGRSISETKEPVFCPEDFSDLGSEMILYYKGKYCRCEKINCYKS